MSREKARRWTLYRTRQSLRVGSGPDLGFGDSVEVAQVSALRAELEEELLSDKSLEAAGEALFRHDNNAWGDRTPWAEASEGERVDHLEAAKPVIEAALTVIKEERDRA